MSENFSCFVCFAQKASKKLMIATRMSEYTLVFERDSLVVSTIISQDFTLLNKKYILKMFIYLKSCIFFCVFYP